MERYTTHPKLVKWKGEVWTLLVYSRVALKISNWYSSSCFFASVPSSYKFVEMKVVMMGHETLLSLATNLQTIFISKQIFPFKSMRSEHVSHMQLKFVRPRHQMLEPKTWKRWRLWINLHSSFLVDGTASPMRSFTTFLSTSNFHASCYAHLVSTIIERWTFHKPRRHKA